MKRNIICHGSQVHSSLIKITLCPPPPRPPPSKCGVVLQIFLSRLLHVWMKGWICAILDQYLHLWKVQCTIRQIPHVGHLPKVTLLPFDLSPQFQSIDIKRVSSEATMYNKSSKHIHHQQIRKIMLGQFKQQSIGLSSIFPQNNIGKILT